MVIFVVAPRTTLIREFTTIFNASKRLMMRRGRSARKARSARIALNWFPSLSA
jgi:hypothetical protein